MKTKAFTVMCVFCAIWLKIYPQNQSENINQYNSNQKPDGKWVYYYRNANTIQAKGYYKNGIPVGRWELFDEYGNISNIKKYRKKRTKELRFYSSGKLESKGWSKLVLDDPKEISYYWDGTWKFFNERGRLIQKYIYRKGEIIKILKDTTDLEI